MYTALDVAHYAITKCFTENHPISNLQLQKILYYIQRDFLQADSIAFEDDFEAWRFGPVIPSVYRVYCGFGGMQIQWLYDRKDIPIFPPEDLGRINRIIAEKREKRPWDMVRETHAPGKAWAITYRNGLGNHQIIEKYLIKTCG